MNYEAVIGLEVHVQIRTNSKVFSRVAAGYGQPENTLTDPVVLALPGALPVMNKAALDAIIKAGLLLGCDIAPVCKWDRKNYFYPDSPKNYQISQYDQPMCLGGAVEIELPGTARNVMGQHKQIPLTRIHLEEDVGKLNHFSADSLVDYNRAGTPLMEIVSDPAMHTADEAFAYLTSLRATMIYGGISDCDMEKGQLRCDANISIRPVGQRELGVKVELKNLNSISFVRDGIAHEIKRQTAVLQAGGTLVQETRDYDGQTGLSQSLRSKEMAHDYRYFPDPDLMPVKVDEAWKRVSAASARSFRSTSSGGFSRSTRCRTRSHRCSSGIARWRISLRPRSGWAASRRRWATGSSTTCCASSARRNRCSRTPKSPRLMSRGWSRSLTPAHCYPMPRRTCLSRCSPRVSNRRPWWSAKA